MDTTGARAGAADDDRSFSLLRLLWPPLLSPVTGFLHTHPLVALLRSHPAPLRLALTLAGVALFVGVYLWTTWHDPLSQGGTAAREPRPSWLPLAVLTALCVAKILGNRKDWPTLFIFASANAGARRCVRLPATHAGFRLSATLPLATPANLRSSAR